MGRSLSRSWEAGQEEAARQEPRHVFYEWVRWLFGVVEGAEGIGCKEGRPAIASWSETGDKRGRRERKAVMYKHLVSVRQFLDDGPTEVVYPEYRTPRIGVR